MSSVEVSEVAYSKVVLHAVKYPYAAIDGYCLGTSKRSAEGVLRVTVDDVVPLFHNGTLALPLEAATTMTDEYARSSGWAVVGYYYANQHVDDESAPAVAGPICETLEEALNESVCVLQLSNGKLADPADPALVARSRKVGAGAWTESLAVKAPKDLQRAFDSGLDIVDFDLHFDDVKYDWRNPHVAQWLLSRK